MNKWEKGICRFRHFGEMWISEKKMKYIFRIRNIHIAYCANFVVDGRGWDEHAIRIERKVVDWIGFSAKHHRAGFMPFIFGDYCYCCWWISQLTVDSLIMQNIVGLAHLCICRSYNFRRLVSSSARQLTQPWIWRYSENGTRSYYFFNQPTIQPTHHFSNLHYTFDVVKQWQWAMQFATNRSNTFTTTHNFCIHILNGTRV